MRVSQKDVRTVNGVSYKRCYRGFSSTAGAADDDAAVVDGIRNQGVTMCALPVRLTSPGMMSESTEEAVQWYQRSPNWLVESRGSQTSVQPYVVLHRISDSSC